MRVIYFSTGYEGLSQCTTVNMWVLETDLARPFGSQKRRLDLGLRNRLIPL